MSDMHTYSIQLRIKRTTVEDAFVSVPVTSSMMKEKEDGNLGIDGDKLLEQALKLGKESGVEWKVEDVTIEPHGLQGPKPEDRKEFVPDSSRVDWFETEQIPEEKQ